jgi:hypothetical protein
LALEDELNTDKLDDGSTVHSARSWIIWQRWFRFRGRVRGCERHLGLKDRHGVGRRSKARQRTSASVAPGCARSGLRRPIIDRRLRCWISRPGSGRATRTTITACRLNEYRDLLSNTLEPRFRTSLLQREPGRRHAGTNEDGDWPTEEAAS